MFRTLLVFAFVFSLPVFAQRGGGGPPGGGRGGPGGPGGKGNPACAPIRQACEKAGYKGRGGGAAPATTEKSPGTLRDCMQKWSSGGTIPGLSIKSTDATAKECVERMKQMKARGGGRGGPGGGPGGPGGPGGRRGGPGGPGVGPGVGGPGGAGRQGGYGGKPGAGFNSGKPAIPAKPSPLLPTTPPPKNP